MATEIEDLQSAQTGPACREQGGRMAHRVPEGREVRDRVRTACSELAARFERTRHCSKLSLQRAAQNLLEKLELSEAYVGWTMVALASAYWRPHVSASSFARRLFLLPPCDHHPASNGNGNLTGDHGCPGCRLAHFRRSAERLGYQVLASDNPREVLGKILEGPVDAVVGIASLDSLERAIDTVLPAGVPCMAVPLLTSHSAGEIVDEDWVAEMIELPFVPSPEPAVNYIHLMRAAAGMFQSAQLQRLAPRLHPVSAETNGHAQRTSPLAVTEALAYDFLRKGGKYSRPFITLAVYDALTGGQGAGPAGAEHVARLPDPVRRAALSIETFHKASLVHDDIEDDDPFRYGDQTLHCRHGIPTAINVGDYMIGLGYRLVSRERHTLGHEVVADILDRLADAHIRLAEGQGAELVWRDSLDKRLTSQEALRIYALKTAPAFEAAIYAGMRLAGPVEPYLEAMAGFARCLGVAFQVLNDLGDWQGDDHNKLTSAGDVLGGRPTVLWALALEGLPETKRRQLESLAAEVRVNEDTIRQIRRLYEEAGVFEKAAELVHQHQQQAEAIAAEIEPCSLRHLLYYLIDSVLDRR